MICCDSVVTILCSFAFSGLCVGQITGGLQMDSIENRENMIESEGLALLQCDNGKSRNAVQELVFHSHVVG
jgi:hypothetical protein